MYVQSLLYLADTFIDVVKIGEYAYYMNTMDHAYQVWRGHPQAKLNHRPGDDFFPLQPYASSEDMKLQKLNAAYPLYFTMCHFWEHDVDFTYVDVGANYGVTVIPTAGYIRRMGRRNRCIAFEPGVAGNLLAYSLELNGLSDLVIVDRRAADAKDGTTLFHSMLGNSASNSTLDIHTGFDIPLARSTVVRTVRLDRLVEGPVVAKIDTEGNDFRVLKGMEKIILNHDVCLTFEFNPSWVSRIAEPLEELLQTEQVFQLYSTNPSDHSRPLQRVEATQDFIDEIRTSSLGWVDLFGIKREMNTYSDFISCFEKRFVRASS